MLFAYLLALPRCFLIMEWRYFSAPFPVTFTSISWLPAHLNLSLALLAWPLLSGKWKIMYTHTALSVNCKLYGNFFVRLNNRTTLLIYTVIAAVASIIAGVLPLYTAALSITQSILIQVARMCLTGCTTMAYLYTSELYPTVIRNMGFSLMTTAVRAGAMLAPLVVTMVKRNEFM